MEENLWHVGELLGKSKAIAPAYTMWAFTGRIGAGYSAVVGIALAEAPDQP
jgi:hypothetical protein